MTLLLAALLSAAPAHAEDAPEYMLGDVGVRIDLPKGWKMLRWSDWDFKAEHPKGPLQLYAWATPIQHPLEAGDAKAWGEVIVDKAKELGGSDASVSEAALETHGSTKAIRSEIAFKHGKLDGRLTGATVAVEGQMFHMALLTAAKSAALSESTMDDLVARLEVQKPPKAAGDATVTATGIETTLPTGWRVPLTQENGELTGRLKSLGIEKTEGCWVAMKPRVGEEPDLMVTCPGGMLLGVVDEHSFAGVDAILRGKLFGDAEVAPGTQVDLSDRTGFLYAPSDGLRMGVVPFADGVARTWATGAASASDDLTAAVTAAMKASTFNGPHPVGPADQLSYYLTYRPTSAPVLGAGLLLLGLIGGLGFALTRGGSRNKYEAIDL